MTNQEILAQFGPRESMHYDLVVVGAGPSGLSAAIHAKQCAHAKGQDISVVVLEKGSEPGAHILSGAVMDPKALSELFPKWQEMGAPLTQKVTEDALLFLGRRFSWRLPHFLLPACFRNQGNYIISLGVLTRWLAQEAEHLGVEIFPGFAATEVLFETDATRTEGVPAVRGVATGNMGVRKDGTPGENFQLGMEILGKYTLFAEGSRGHLGKQLIAQYSLDKDADPQTYALGIKEVWEIDPQRHRPGLVVHTAGWPMDNNTYGGGFLYHASDNKIALGFITGLDYRNPYLSPFEEFQRWKTHPSIRWYLEGQNAGLQTAKRLAYGARSITAGGLLSLPHTVFPGGALVGCNAGFLNVSRIKGSHAAIKSGMLAGQAATQAILEGRQHDTLHAYPQSFKSSWLYGELYKARNFKAWFKKGLFVATLMNGIEQFLFRGHVPWTVHRKQADHLCLQPAQQSEPIAYAKPDGKLTFDRLSSVFLSNTHHAEEQVVHLVLKDPSIPVQVNQARYAGPESRYCPAAVYEFVRDQDNLEHLHIHAQNCIHCKTCDIKDPTQNIEWTAPQGGEGPHYAEM